MKVFAVETLPIAKLQKLENNIIEYIVERQVFGRQRSTNPWKRWFRRQVLLYSPFCRLNYDISTNSN